MPRLPGIQLSEGEYKVQCYSGHPHSSRVPYDDAEWLVVSRISRSLKENKLMITLNLRYRIALLSLEVQQRVTEGSKGHHSEAPAGGGRRIRRINSRARFRPISLPAIFVSLTIVLPNCDLGTPLSCCQQCAEKKAIIHPLIEALNHPLAPGRCIMRRRWLPGSWLSLDIVEGSARTCLFPSTLQR